MTLRRQQRRVLLGLAGALVVATVAYLVARSSSADGDAVATAGTLPALTTTTTADAATATTTRPPRSTTTAAPVTEAAPSTTVAPPPSTSAARPAAPQARATTAPAGPSPTGPAYRSSISPVTAEDLGASWNPDIPACARPEELRLLTVSHWGYDGEVHEGRIVVHARYAEAIVEVFRKVFEARFPIERMVPVAAYGGDDGASMRDNNTSGFNCRYVAGTTRVSEHALGQAIDVNPLHNPYVKGGAVDPPEGARWADRTLGEPGMITAGDAVVRAFAEAGWTWGGTWRSGQDHQHFSAGGR